LGREYDSTLKIKVKGQNKKLKLRFVLSGGGECTYRFPASAGNAGGL